MPAYAPELIHVNINAADGYPRFVEASIPATTSDTITPEQVTLVLTRLRGRMHRLLGWLDDANEVLVSVRDTQEEGGLLVVSHSQPPFEDWYRVAAEPPPYINTHGDYVFDLEHTDV